MKRKTLSLDLKLGLMKAKHVTKQKPPWELPLEHRCRVREAAARLGLRTDKTRELFEHEPGVMVVSNHSQGNKRPYRTLLIPESVLLRVIRRMCRITPC